MLHPTQSKLQIPRTKRFPTTSARNKSVTSNFISTSAQTNTLTNSVTKNRNATRTGNLPMRVAVMLQRGNTPRHQNVEIPEQDIHSATHSRCRIATRSFYFCSQRTPCPLLPNLCPLCLYVRVSSEYSDIPSQANRDFLERNPRIESVKRKSTLTSFLNPKHLPSVYNPALRRARRRLLTCAACHAGRHCQPADLYQRRRISRRSVQRASE